MPAIFDGRQPRGIYSQGFLLHPGGAASNVLEIVAVSQGGVVVESIWVLPDATRWQMSIGVPVSPSFYSPFALGAGLTGAVPVGGLECESVFSQWNGPPGGFTGYVGGNFDASRILEDVELYVPTGMCLRLNGPLNTQMAFTVVFRELVSVGEDRGRTTYVTQAGL